MGNSSGIAQLRVGELVATIGEKGLAAGAGAAGAVTLALAAACAAKAAAISLIRQPANDSLSAALDRIARQVEPPMQGDVVAARALMEAARRIQLTNSAEAEAHKDRLRSSS